MATAEIHRATVTPSKLDLLAAWLPQRDWFDGDASALERIAAYRFVDSAGEVGLETFLVGAGERTFQVPMTYRGAPLADAEDFLIGEMHHSVLGRRWVYDALGDPVYLAEVRRVIAEGDHEADLSQGDKTMTVVGSGAVDAGATTVHVVRDIDDATDAPPGVGTLTGRWERDGSVREAVLVILRR